MTVEIIVLFIIEIYLKEKLLLAPLIIAIDVVFFITNLAGNNFI